MKQRISFKEMSLYGNPEHSPGFLLWHVSMLWRSCIEGALRSLGLTHPQFVVIATLGWLTREGERVTQATIGRLSGIDPNTLSQIIRGLEQRGLIKREPSSDGRAKNPLLTANGIDLLKQALPAVETEDTQFFDPLSDREMESVIQVFQKLIRV